MSAEAVLDATPPAAQAAAAEHGQIERVIDVPLAVTLRFGQRHLTLREVLALNTGSLVELDRQVEEPVELMLGDRLIARGEVVVIDGNYGLRVTEVMENAASHLQHTQAQLRPEPSRRESPLSEPEPLEESPV